MDDGRAGACDLVDRLIHGREYSIRAYRSAGEDVTPPPFGRQALHVQRHAGSVVAVTLIGRDWAEMDPRQDVRMEGSVLMLQAEDYCLDIDMSEDRG